MAEAMAPRGRPPTDHEFDAVEGGWVHKETRRPFDAEAHAARVRAKKVACLRELYWERGGRQKRLARYVRKRKSKHSQQTLDDAFAQAVPHTPQLGGWRQSIHSREAYATTGHTRGASGRTSLYFATLPSSFGARAWYFLVRT